MLEGDSLSYVSVGSEVDRRRGYLPEGWEHLTVAEIDALEPRTQTPADKLLKPCDSEILLRALAVTGVVANHASTNTNWHFGGGADVLMLLVGFNLARFNFGRLIEIGRAHVCTPVTNAHLVCRLLLEKH